jgi:hypothetical protein
MTAKQQINTIVGIALRASPVFRFQPQDEQMPHTICTHHFVLCTSCPPQAVAGSMFACRNENCPQAKGQDNSSFLHFRYGYE